MSLSDTAVIQNLDQSNNVDQSTNIQGSVGSIINVDTINIINPNQLANLANLDLENAGITQSEQLTGSIAEPFRITPWSNEQLSVIASVEKKLEQGEEKFGQVLGFCDLYIRLGYVAGQAGNHEEALRYASRALTLNQASEAGWVLQGSANLSLARPEQALEDFDRAIDLNPGNPRTLNSKALTLYKLERYGEAIDIYDISLKLDPSASTWHDKGLTFYELKRYEEAETCLENSLLIDDNSIPTMDAIAKVKRRLHKIEDSLSYVQKASEMRGQNTGDIMSQRIVLPDVTTYQKGDNYAK